MTSVEHFVHVSVVSSWKLISQVAYLEILRSAELTEPTYQTVRRASYENHSYCMNRFVPNCHGRRKHLNDFGVRTNGEIAQDLNTGRCPVLNP